MHRSIRVGKIAFTNILPIYYGLSERDLHANLVSAVPSRLNQDLAAGKIDITPISSFAYAEQYPQYVLLPDLSISAVGDVGSIFLFSKEKKLASLRNSRIALPNTSATSTALLRILLERFEKGSPEYVTMAPDLDSMLEQTDAALLIGDHAIRAKWLRAGYHAIDLGREWYQRTQQSMTFAVWAVRREVAETRSQEIALIYQQFIETRQRCFQNLAPVVEEARRAVGVGDPTFWLDYYHRLDYQFGEQQKKGLSTYYRYGEEMGLLPPDVEIRTIDLPIEA